MILENTRIAGLSLIVLLAVMAFAVAVTTTSAGGNPTLYLGNTFCTDVRSDLLEGIRLQGGTLSDGTYDFKVNGVQYSVTLSNTSGTIFDWSSTLGMDAVIVKGGPNANVYAYNEATGDTGLYAPDNSSGGPAGLSHVSFCYDKESVTATPVTPTSTPVTPTSTPVTPTSTPVTPTSTPVTPTSTPVTPTATPTETPFSEVSPTIVAPMSTPTDTPEAIVLGTVVGPETGVAGGIGDSGANGGLWTLIGAMFAASLAGMTAFTVRYVRAR